MIVEQSLSTVVNRWTIVVNLFQTEEALAAKRRLDDVLKKRDEIKRQKTTSKDEPPPQSQKAAYIEYISKKIEPICLNEIERCDLKFRCLDGQPLCVWMSKKGMPLQSWWILWTSLWCYWQDGPSDVVDMIDLVMLTWYVEIWPLSEMNDHYIYSLA